MIISSALKIFTLLFSSLEFWVSLAFITLIFIHSLRWESMSASGGAVKKKKVNNHNNRNSSKRYELS